MSTWYALQQCKKLYDLGIDSKPILECEKLLHNRGNLFETIKLCNVIILGQTVRWRLAKVAFDTVRVSGGIALLLRNSLWTSLQNPGRSSGALLPVGKSSTWCCTASIACYASGL